MRSVLGYAAPVIVFISAIIGLSGLSRRPNAAGLAGLSPFGWTLVVLATLSFAVAIYGVYNREAELKKAREEVARLRTLAFSDVSVGVDHLVTVLDFAVLAPYIAARSIPAPPIPKTYVSGPRILIDFRSEAVIADLQNLVLDRIMRVKGPYAQPIPFGTDQRPVIAIIAEETARARDEIDFAIQRYDASRGITVDVFEAGSALLRAPFLAFMTGLEDSWKRRSRMEEDATAPDIVNLRMIGSGVTGGSKADYLEMLDRLDRLRTALNESA